MKRTPLFWLCVVLAVIACVGSLVCGSGCQVRPVPATVIGEPYDSAKFDRARIVIDSLARADSVEAAK